ncbi:MAG: 16S rRNA (cytosine(967)-C(5))-methyltransferase RsmB [Candidatus Arsenophonus melophagi]|nr:16S rRNA (cytosine(967)-C(5))-methyltransferase RsmB [Candidatus Arsenophonus melophagi]
MKKKYNLRSICAKVIAQVIDQKKSLSTVLPHWKKKISDKDKTLLQELNFGVLRVFPLLEWFTQQLITKPLKGKKRIIYYLIMIGIYQLRFTRIPPHAALGETVDGAIKLKLPQLKGFINGVLRQYQRKEHILDERINNKKINYFHPKWLLEKIKRIYPTKWQEILEVNNQKPPMWLRVNQLQHSTHDYLKLLAQVGLKANLSKESKCAIKLQQPCSINKLPGFKEGWVTIQDLSAQQCVEFLAPKNGEYILDLCAAPGGKTTYILEIAPKAHVLAVDINEIRIKHIQENLDRLKLYAKVIIGDGLRPQEWTSGMQFDRILLDAPCSSTGVIRRHPDIKWIREPIDILQLVQLQYKILEAIWPYLKSKGTLVYATCSILADENREQIKKFLLNHTNASCPEAYLNNNNMELGQQILPTKCGGDGFFYASLIKN